MLYDTHSHPYLAKTIGQETCIQGFFEAWWTYLNSIWCDIESSLTCVDLAKKHSWVFATIWIHPTHVLEYKDSLRDTIDQLEKIYRENPQRIVAIGEIGLDYHWLLKLSEKYALPEAEIVALQKEFFRAQIWLARKLELPVVIHNRNSADDVLELLKEENYTNFVFHCYSEDVGYARKLLDFAPQCKLWFWWVVTFKNARVLQDTVKEIPLENIIIETDSPYLTPDPYRGKRENEPSLVKYVLSKIIDLRNEPSEFITQQIFKNSIEFFGV